MKSAQGCGRIIFMAGESDVIRMSHHDCVAEVPRRRICMGREKLIYPRRFIVTNYIAFDFSKHATSRGILFCQDQFLIKSGDEVKNVSPPLSEVLMLPL